MSYSHLLKNISEDEYNEKNRILHEKVNNKQALNKGEEIFFCNCLKFKDLPLYPFCIDEYFRRIFLSKHPLFPKEFDPTKPKDIDVYNIMVSEWFRIMNAPDNEETLINMVGKETRNELKALRKSHPIIQPNFNSKSYISKRTGLIEWSKFRYLMIRDLWTEEFYSSPYKLYLDDRKIIIDQESLAHILSRHYGQTMKTYFTEKSFFTKDILHTEIHTKLEEIFAKIDYSLLLRGQSLNEINIRLNGTIYRIYLEEKKIREKKKEITIVRLSTIFPVENAGMLKKIETQFDEYIIDKELSLFLKN
jgi:hypothetical protein